MIVLYACTMYGQNFPIHIRRSLLRTWPHQSRLVVWSHISHRAEIYTYVHVRTYVCTYVCAWTMHTHKPNFYSVSYINGREALTSDQKENAAIQSGT